MSKAIDFHVGDFGIPLEATVRDSSGGGADISFATTITYRIVRPDGSAQDFAGAFVNTGTDGQVTGTVPSGTFLARGEHQVFLRLSDGGTRQQTVTLDTLTVSDAYET
ncbi:MAG: hypothetical protein AAGE52_01310 [Myxococcota bacterium]